MHVPKKVKSNPQDIWIAIIEKAVENLKQAPIELQPHLKRIQEFSNIPRNKNKFTNFCKNSLRLFQEPVIAKLWTHLDTFKAQEKDTENGNTALPGAEVVGDSQGKKVKEKKKAVTEEAAKVADNDPVSSEVEVKKDKKKKRKELEESAEPQQEERGDEDHPAAASEETDKKKRKKDKKVKKSAEEE